MATRAEVLRELGLAPHWRLRARPGTAGSATPAAAGPAMLDAAAAPEAADARQARIAALDRDALVAEIAGCTACALCRTRRNTVPGVGDPNARWLFVGEAPGADEDVQGEPFVGQAGRLLDNMLAALGLGRSNDVYIANVLKCRPPNNRTPEPTEVEACRPFLDRQIELVAPKLIVALGKSAASALLRSDASVANLRNRVHRYRGIPLIVTYHPAYLLRTPVDKAKAWEDLLFARRTLRESLAAAGA